AAEERLAQVHMRLDEPRDEEHAAAVDLHLAAADVGTGSHDAIAVDGHVAVEDSLGPHRDDGGAPDHELGHGQAASAAAASRAMRSMSLWPAWNSATRCPW